MLPRRNDAASMKVINWRKVRRAWAIGVYAGMAERILNSLKDKPARIMADDGMIDIRHAVDQTPSTTEICRTEAPS